MNPTPPSPASDPPGREHDNRSLRDERFRLLVQGVTDYAVFMLDPTGRVVCWNTGAERVFGYTDPEVVGHHYAVFFTPEDVRAGEPDREIRVAAEQGRFESECWRVRKDGARFLASVVLAAIPEGGAGKLLGYSQITRDVTDRKRLEEQLRQAQKMEAVGSLAAGVAHDFNNLLTVIIGYGDVLLGTLHRHDQAREAVSHMVSAGHRAAALTRQLLAFSRRQMLKPRVLDLNALLAEFDPLLRRLVGAGVEVTLSPGPDLRRVEADPVQLEQVLINLAVNARDAMPAGGRLAIETANVELGGPGVPGLPDVRPGPYVRLVVSDTGVGMDEATRARAFEPFFTTKEVGGGTGLGLATVYGIVKQTSGHVEVSSQPGAGTMFAVYLPAADGPVREDPPHPFSAEVPGGMETVLLAEDEPGIRELGRHLLEKGGYTVLVAADGREAVEVGTAYPGPVHLLVIDVVMPSMGGVQAANRLGPLRPGMRVLYLSGYSEEAVARQGAFASPGAFLQKPFTPRDLAAKVREVLDAPG